MDAFFASVEQRDDPALRGLPVIVGGGRGGEGSRGVVTAASYEARVFGVRSAMPMRQALALCPQARRVRARMGVYVAESRRLMEILETFSPDIEPLSIDEAFLDITGVLHLRPRAEPDPRTGLARDLKARVRTVLNLPCTVGIAPNKFLAKLASDHAKPDGLRVVSPEEAAAWLAPMPTSVIPGIGPKAGERLARLGVRTIADLRSLVAGRPPEQIARDFGRHALRWPDLCMGLDDRPIEVGRERLSIGQERTFSVDERDHGALRATVLGQIETCAARLREKGLHARRVVLKVREPSFETHTRSATLPTPTDDTGVLWQAAATLLASWLDARPGPLRLIGIALQELSPPALPGLFDSPATASRVDRAADAIARKLGPGIIARAGSLRPPSIKPPKEPPTKPPRRPS